jgi:hypothetical protein
VCGGSGIHEHSRQKSAEKSYLEAGAVYVSMAGRNILQRIVGREEYDIADGRILQGVWRQYI